MISSRAFLFSFAQLAVMVLCLCLVAESPVPPATTTTATSTTTAPSRVTDALLSKLRAELTFPEDKLTDVAKIRRYRSALRLGREIEQDFPNAENLYVVHSHMMQAMRGLVTMQTDDVKPDDVLALARKIVAANAPPDWKINADILLTQIDVDKAAGTPANVRPHPVQQILKTFIDRYGQSDESRTQAIMQAIAMAQSAKQDDYANGLAADLENNYPDVPRIRAFLRDQLNRRGAIGWSLLGDLTLLDGRTLHLPRDIYGKYILLHFWNPEIPRCLDDIDALKAYRDKYKDRPFEIISICTGKSRAALEKAVKDHNIDWPQHFTGKGDADPMVQMYGVQSVPYFYCIGTDGRIYENSVGLTGGVRQMDSVLQRQWRKQARLDMVRTGAFMIHTILAAPAAPASLPADVWLAITTKAKDAYIAFPVSQKAAPMQDLRKLCAEAEKAHPDAVELPALRALRLVALHWLATKNNDAPAGQEAMLLARQIANARPVPALRVLADYLLVRAAIIDQNLNRRAAGDAVQQFMAAYAKTPEEWLALPLVTDLAYEVGHFQLADSYRYQMAQHFENSAHPEIRALLRNALDWGLDAGQPFQAQLTRLDGTTINVPQDFAGKIVVVHVWSATAEPEAPWANADPLWRNFNPTQTFTTSNDVVIVAANFDRTRDAADAFAKKHPDWIVTWSPLGPDDPAIRWRDVYPFPATWIMRRNGNGYTSEEALDIGFAVDVAANRVFNVTRTSLTTLNQWQTAYNEVTLAQDTYATTTAISGGKWTIPSDWLTHLETATERLCREGVTLLSTQIQSRTADLLAKLANLTPAPGGGWDPPRDVILANTDIRVITQAAKNMNAAVALRTDMPWATASDIPNLLRTAAEAQYLRVPKTPDAQAQRQQIARFFPEVPATSISPATPAQADSCFFQLKPLNLAGNAQPNESAATFVRTDEKTLGNWKNTYGVEGYYLAGNRTPRPPDYAIVTRANHDEAVWADSTDDARALAKPAAHAKDRFAACWHNNDNRPWSFDVTLLDNKPHQLALYCVDWDKSTRRMTVELRNPDTDALLDTRDPADFSAGKYLLWNIRGHVELRIINAPNSINATISAIFFDPAGK